MRTSFLPLASGFADLVGHHRSLLDDDVRTKAFLRAIATVVRPGDVVLDLGAGTGVLSLAAARARAKRVYAIEHGPIGRIGAALTRENGATNVTWIEASSRDVVLREPADVLVSECLGVLGAGGTMMQAVVDLRERHLREGGTVVPRSVSIRGAPVEAPADYRWVTTWSKRRHAMTFAAAGALATNNMYNTLFERSALVGRPARIASIDLATGSFDGNVAGRAAYRTTRAATLHGFAAWFAAELAPGVVLDTAPGCPATVWRQVFLPLERPVRVARGTPVELFFTMTPAMVPGHVAYVDWRGTIGDAAFARSTRWSYPPRVTDASLSPRAEKKSLRARR